MPKTTQPVGHSELEALPDYYPDITAEGKTDDYGRLNGMVVALDCGLPERSMVLERRNYYSNHTHKPAVKIPK